MTKISNIPSLWNNTKMAISRCSSISNSYKRLIWLKIHVCHYCARVIFLCINCAYIINPFLIDVQPFLVKTIAYTTTPNCLSEIKSLLLLKHLECDMILSVTCRTLVTKHPIWLVWQIARFKLKQLPPDMLRIRHFVHKTFWV